MTERQAAIDVVLQAAQLCQQVQSDMVTTDSLEKKDRSPVTVADFGVQALICQAIRRSFPNDVIVAEEDSRALRTNLPILERVTRYVEPFVDDVSPQKICEWIDEGQGKVGGRFWTLDPIDGTKGFLRRDQYAVALALVIDGEVELGVLGCPNLSLNLSDPSSPTGCIFAAVRGEGTQMLSLDGQMTQQVHVSNASPRFAESFESAHGDHSAHVQIARQLGIMTPPIRMDSQAKYGLVARGDAAVYLRLPNPATPDYRECIWDHAAGMIVVQEAGGEVTDAGGQRLDLLQGRRMMANRGVVATNGTLHSQVLECIRSVEESMHFN